MSLCLSHIDDRQASELRDGGARYMGKGVLKAVENVNKLIAPAVTGKDETTQTAIDKVRGKVRGVYVCMQ